MKRAPVVGIAGVGLIGASIGLRAVQLGWNAVGWDHSVAHLQVALGRGAVGAAAASLPDLAGRCDVLVLAAPPDATLGHLAELADCARPPLVIDVASVKVPVARAAGGLAEFVATHPIAGSELSGPGAARPDLFAGRYWTYDAAAQALGALRARRFIEAMGGRPFAVSNAEHDSIVAATSHLPQLLSVVLGARVAETLADHDAAPLCGTGLRSMLRLADSAWDVWRPVLSLNAVPVAQEVRRLADVLTGVAADLEAGRTAALGSRFAAAGGVVAALGWTGGPCGSAASAEDTSNER